MITSRTRREDFGIERNQSSKEITVTHNSVFAAHRLQCRMTIRENRHPAFGFSILHHHRRTYASFEVSSTTSRARPNYSAVKHRFATNASFVTQLHLRRPLEVVCPPGSQFPNNQTWSVRSGQTMPRLDGASSTPGWTCRRAIIQTLV